MSYKHNNLILDVIRLIHKRKGRYFTKRDFYQIAYHMMEKRGHRSEASGAWFRDDGSGPFRPHMEFCPDGQFYEITVDWLQEAGIDVYDLESDPEFVDLDLNCLRNTGETYQAYLDRKMRDAHQ